MLENGQYLYLDMADASIESIFVYSCTARKTLIGDDINLELKPLNKISSLSGFFTYGEFFSDESSFEKKLLNHTMTVLALSENNYNTKKNKESFKKQNIKKAKHKTLNALTHLISQTAKELEEINNSLESKIQKEIQKNREKDKKLFEQSRLAQMGEMISMIAHQWRQPLGAISSTVMGIDTKIQSGKYNLDTLKNKNKFLDFIANKHKNINEHIKFLSETIDDFRNFFKPNKSMESSSLTVVIEKALYLMQVSLKNKNIKIIKEFKMNDKLFIYKNELIQVILNILKNSEDNFIDRNIKNREIRIRTDKISLLKDYKNENKLVCSIKISDNGGGIAEDIINSVFDPYFSTKNEKNGTGLGLYMSKMIIEEHHEGILRVENIDNGVCFEIILSIDKNT